MRLRRRDAAGRGGARVPRAWGSVAERLGKSFWLWGAACLVFGGVPVLFLAFDGSMPRR